MPKEKLRSGVYVLVSKITKEIYYVGSSIWAERRLRQHRNALRRGAHVNKQLQELYNKEKALTGFIVLRCEAHEIELYENHYILELNPKCNVPSAFTRTTPGKALAVSAGNKRLTQNGVVRVNGPMSEEHKRKISKAQKGVPKPSSHIPCSEEKKVKISEALKASTKNKLPRKPLSKETKSKISAAHQGMKSSPEHCEAQRQAQLKYHRNKRDEKYLAESIFQHK